MGNTNYIKGRKKEYKIMAYLKQIGYDIAQRTAGSHSPIDIFAIDKERKHIKFIQAKPDNYPKSKAEQINKELDYLKGSWEVSFELL